MSLRNHLKKIEAEGQLVNIQASVSKVYEISGLLKKLEPETVFFHQITKSKFKAAGNLFCSKMAFADYFGIGVSEIIPTLTNAIDHRSPCEVIDEAPCQEVVIMDPDLNELPILRHCEMDGGNYISSGIVIARHPVHGQNVDFHRCMQFSEKEMAMRVVRSRHFDAFLKDQKEVDVAICIGNSPNIMAAAATSISIGINEMEIANALEPVKVVRAKTVDVMVPAETEFVLEGTVYLDKLHAEGPFVDLTETYDIVRQEPVFIVKTVTHRKDAIWYGLLPGGLEHKLLMGMPREPTIFKKVNEVVRCLDVNINPGGCSWLHAVVQIDKKHETDGKKAIQAAFEGHSSLKLVYVVDDDIDIYNPIEVEWALATRFQGDQDLLIKAKEPGSSLDPSSEPGTHLTTKMGFDLTKPLAARGKSFKKASFPSIELDRFVKK
jgi:2,5-furandicarboxylate decarboxylase 1